MSIRGCSGFLLLLLFIVIIEAQYNSTNCGANTCAQTSGKHICFNGQCVECNPTPGSTTTGDCMCDAGEYCVSDPNSEDYATCQNYDSKILGNKCDPLVTSSNYYPGVTDQLFCGKVIWNFTTNTSETVEWTGFCDAGVCRHCADRAGNGGSMCPGKEGYACLAGRFVNSNAGEYSWAYLAADVTNWSVFWSFIWLYIFLPVGYFLYRTFIKDPSDGSSRRKPSPDTQLEMQRVETGHDTVVHEDYTKPPPKSASVRPDEEVPPPVSARSSQIVSAQTIGESDSKRSTQRGSSQISSPPQYDQPNRYSTRSEQDPPEQSELQEENWDEAVEEYEEQ